jgi:hypothetical protein
MVTPAVNSIMSYSGHKKNYRVRFPSLLLNQKQITYENSNARIN